MPGVVSLEILPLQGKNADEAREWIEAWRKDSKSRTQPAPEAKSGKSATSSESNGAGTAMKSEGAEKVDELLNHQFSDMQFSPDPLKIYLQDRISPCRPSSVQESQAAIWAAVTASARHTFCGEHPAGCL